MEATETKQPVVDETLLARVDDACQHWRQGDVFGLRGGFHVAATKAPITDAAVQSLELEPDGGALRAIETAARGAALVSQTCDIVRSARERPYVTVAPVVDLDEVEAKLAAAYKRPRYLPLPQLAADLFADLDLAYPVEKAVLLDRDLIRGVDGDKQVSDTAWAVGRKFSRFPFPDDLHKSIRKVVSRLGDKYGHLTSNEGATVSDIVDILVEATPSWDAPEIDVNLLFVMPPGHLPALEEPPQPSAWASREPLKIADLCERLQTPDLTPDDRAWLWSALLEAWVDLCEPTGRIQRVTAEVLNANELTYDRASNAPKLDLDQLTVSDEA